MSLLPDLDFAKFSHYMFELFSIKLIGLWKNEIVLIATCCVKYLSLWGYKFCDIPPLLTLTLSLPFSLPPSHSLYHPSLTHVCVCVCRKTYIFFNVHKYFLWSGYQLNDISFSVFPSRSLFLAFSLLLSLSLSLSIYIYIYSVFLSVCRGGDRKSLIFFSVHKYLYSLK